MADKDESKQVPSTEEPHVSKEATTGSPVSETRAAAYNRQHRRGLIFTLVIVAIVTVGLLIMASALVMHGLRQSSLTSRDYPMYGDSSYGSRMGRSPFGYGTSVQTQANNGSVTTTVYTYLTGVVTAVNSDNIVIAGNGKQTTIMTNASTTYDGGIKPVVNDTVTVIGTTSGSTTTATEIGVTN